ncbi:uncharacterized protein [Macrobrachium rosenbergii]|uniref:uncharacterized protein n=1 Tax=Macrobrachium rosenbergii TaxID=79674 RepID=UPI0034D3C59B
MKKGVEEVHCSSEKLLISIDQNIKLLMNRLEKLKKNKTKFNESDAQLEAAADFISAAPLMQQAEELLQAMEGPMTKFQEDKRGECHIKKEILKMKESLENFVKDTERTTGEGEAELEEEERSSVVNITVTDLRSPHGCLRGEAQREIFAVMIYEGTLRVAPVKIECNNQVSLTHLQEGVLPPRCFFIELESLMQWSPSPSPSPPPCSLPRAFLDLVDASIPLGRIIVRVTENGLKGLNFLYMCAGGMGPSYAYSHISSMAGKGGPGERVSLGCYVSSGGGAGGGGTSTRAVLSSREDWQREWERKRVFYKRKPCKAGEVRGDISYEDASEFWIITRDALFCGPGHCFGMVEEGLDVLLTTILKYPGQCIRKVRVGECGLIL